MNTESKINQPGQINELVAALAKAQGSMKPAVFNRVNPHYKNRYADFTSCMDACRGPLAENGLAVMQYCETIEGRLSLVTMLAHVSGQSIKSEFPLISAKADSQGFGSAMTYAKRYCLCGMIGIVADEEGDDDGEAAVGRGRQEARPAPQPKVAQKIIPAQVATIKTLEGKLDQECKDKLYAWLNNSYKIERIEDVPLDAFLKVLGAFENAVKFIEQQQQSLEVAHA